jgi:hypothetical protein
MALRCSRGTLLVLILRSGVFAASRRMKAGLSWFETRKVALLTMRVGISV